PAAMGPDVSPQRLRLPRHRIAAGRRSHGGQAGAANAARRRPPPARIPAAVTTIVPTRWPVW
ncbi:hypothetical protein, partial [uncultured Lamprocystis sp.]|uniref:hypothetical protein n=1 Tax=uncultured Lamprocystis sp. TaxID=543132 RepID=UPI0025CDA167